MIIIISSSSIIMISTARAGQCRTATSGSRAYSCTINNMMMLYGIIHKTVVSIVQCNDTCSTFSRLNMLVFEVNVGDHEFYLCRAGAGRGLSVFVPPNMDGCTTAHETVGHEPDWRSDGGLCSCLAINAHVYYIYIYTCLNVCIYIYIYAYMYLSLSIYIYIYTCYTYMHNM